MSALWAWWVARATRPADVRPLALSRILLASCVIVDLLTGASLGLVDDLWSLPRDGGISAFAGADFALRALGPDAGLLLFGTTLVCMSLVALGLLSRPATVLGVLACAQMGALYPPGDRGADFLIRTALLLLVFTRAHRRYAVGNRLLGRAPEATTPGWAHDAIRLLLVHVYLSAGILKIGTAGWFSLTTRPQLYRIMVDPLAGNLDATNPVWIALQPLFRVAGMLAVVWETLAPVFFSRHAHWWGIFGVLMHLGIAAGMSLGIFSWAVLSLYPVVMWPFLRPLFDRLDARRASAAA